MPQPANVPSSTSNVAVFVPNRDQGKGENVLVMPDSALERFWNVLNEESGIPEMDVNSVLQAFKNKLNKPTDKGIVVQDKVPLLQFYKHLVLFIYLFINFSPRCHFIDCSVALASHTERSDPPPLPPPIH